MTGIIRSRSQDSGLENSSDDWDNEYKAMMADRMVLMYSQIAECLNEKEIEEIHGILSKVVQLSKDRESQTEEQLNKFYTYFLDMVGFRTGISATLLKQAIRSFLLIEDDPHDLGYLVMNRFQEMICKEYPLLALDIKFKEELMKTYFRVLNMGTEEASHINLTVLGMSGVGKTSLVRHLCGVSGENVSRISEADITVNTCVVTDKGEWVINGPEGNLHLLSMRINELLARYMTPDNSLTSMMNVSQVSQGTMVESNKNQEDIVSNSEYLSSYEEFKQRLTMIDLTDKRDNKIMNNLKTTANRSCVSKLSNRSFTASVLDFSGHSLYYVTHHFFINPRTIYIIAWDLSTDLNHISTADFRAKSRSNLIMENFMTGYSCLDAFKFWVKSIFIYLKQNRKLATIQGKPNRWMPKIILVGTHADKVTKAQLSGRTLDQYKEDYFSEALQPFIGTQVLKLIHDKKFLINTMHLSENTIKCIRQEIQTVASEWPLFTQNVSTKHLPLERELLYCKMKGKKVIKLSDLQQISADLEYPLTDPDDISKFLDQQQAMGSIICFNNDALRELIILSPQWIVDIFKAFVTHMPDKKATLLKSWKYYKEFGQLRQDLIDAILNKHDLTDYKQEVLTFMEIMNIFVKPVIFNGETNREDVNYASQGHHEYSAYYFADRYVKTQTTVEEFYHVPCMLPPTPDSKTLKMLFKITESAVNTPTLCFCILDGILPPCVFHQIIATALKEIPMIALYSGRKLLFNGLGSFKVTNTTQLTLWYLDNVIHLCVTFKSETESHKDRQTFCRGLQERFGKLVIDVMSNSEEHNTEKYKRKEDLFEIRVKCPKCPEQAPFYHKTESETKKLVDYNLSLLKVENLQDPNREVECGWCNRIVNAKDALDFWFS